MVVVMQDLSLESNDNSSFELTTKKQSSHYVSFVEALHEKYVDQEEFDDQFIIPKDKSISTEITFVGFGSVSNVQKQLRRLNSIDLSGRNIRAAGNIDELKGSLNQVNLLNLADNALTWQEVINIISCLPNLRELILTSNDLYANDCHMSYPTKPLKKLSSLTLGKVGLDWDSIVYIVSRIWTSVERIDLWDNQMDEVKLKLNNQDDYHQFTNHILELRLSQNNLSRIDWIVDVGTLDSLIELDLSRCKLEDFSIQGPVLHSLGRLKALNIAYNNICEWSSISSLNHLSNLTNLICNDNPFFIREKLAKAFAVARMGNLKFLNREEITKVIRRDSEILYLRKTFPEYKAFKEGKNPEFTRQHPRYEDVVEIYGLPEDLREKKNVDKYVVVNLCHNSKSISKKMPCDLRISNLQMLCKRLFKLKPSSKIEIICCADGKDMSATSYPLDKDSQTLHFFSVKNNYNLLIKVEE